MGSAAERAKLTKCVLLRAWHLGISVSPEHVVRDSSRAWDVRVPEERDLKTIISYSTPIHVPYTAVFLLFLYSSAYCLLPDPGGL